MKTIELKNAFTLASFYAVKMHAVLCRTRFQTFKGKIISKL